MKDFKAGHLLKQNGYKSFQPSQINREWIIDNPKVLEALSSADRNLGRLDMFSEYVPNLELFIRMHVAKEATLSSRIENTQTEIEEVLLPEEEIKEERRNDWKEVNNYINALWNSIESLKDLPFSTRLLKDAHQTLMTDVRGEHKAPGEFRTSQNWIGGSNPSNARFVPPTHETVPELISDIELFAHNDELRLPPLIKIGIMHYQFETIHPFLDGNGRIGRLMVPLYLVATGILKQPVLYLSDYLERNRSEYYDRLTRVREEDAMDEWLHFFLDGITETTRSGVNTFNRILKFKKEWEEKIQTWKPHGNTGIVLFNRLFKMIYTNASMVAEATSVSMPTAYKLIDEFVRHGLLKEITGAQRGKLYVFEPYLALFR
ncbi:MAG: Fic family protein [Verrucomicrobiota bacterium]